jgi:hypothetical protein
MDSFTVVHGNVNDNHQLGTGFLICKGIISTIERVEFISDRMSCIMLRGHWCDIVLNVHAVTKDKIEDRKDSSYKEQEHVFNQFPKYHIKIRRFQCGSR